MAQQPIPQTSGMTDEKLLLFATEFRDGMLGGRTSHWMCAMISLPLVSLLGMYGIRGRCMESDLGDCNHVWILLDDGRALDCTADQFNHFADCDFPPVYLGPPAVVHEDAREFGS